MNAIGIVDSGLGGYTVYDRLRTAYPTTAFVFLADQIHAPYGNKSPEDILSITYLNILWFYEQGIQEVILACNTASSVALEFIRPIFPEITIHGIIDLTVDALDLQAEDKVLILATQATTQSEAYPDAIMMIQPQAKAKGIAMVDLVKHIEMLSDEATIDAYLKKSLSIDVRSYNKIVLGCTHYPIIKDQLTKHVDGTLYDSRDAIVGLLRGRDLPSGESRCFTTGDPRRATLQVKTIFGNDETFTHAVTDPK